MFEDFETADLIAYHFAKIDARCRRDLQNNTIVSERDYVSTFATRIRDAIMPVFECHSQTLRQHVEHENGVDGIIIFKYANEVKVGMFEAKRPQFNSENYRWDYLSSRNISHFTEQIENQRKWKNAFALWEVFINESPNGTLVPPLEHDLSSCVWNTKAHAFANKERLYPNRWTTRKLKKLLKSDGINIYNVIFDIISCKQGKKFTIGRNGNVAVVLNPNDTRVSMEIPLPSEFTNEPDPKITRFLESENLESYTFVDLNRKHEIQ